MISPYKSVNFEQEVLKDLKMMEVRLLGETIGGIYTTSHIINRLVCLGMEAIPKNTPLVDIFGVAKNIRDGARRLQKVRDEEAQRHEGIEREATIEIPVHEQYRFWPVLGANRR